MSGDQTVTIEGLFRANFWEGEDKPIGYGFNLLLERMMNGKETWKDLASFLEKVAKVEEDYKKSINSLVKSTPLGKEEIGTAKAAFQSIQTQLSVNADRHHQMSVQLSGELAKSVVEYKESQKEVRKKVFADVSKMKGELEKEIKRCESLRDKYVQKTKDAVKCDREFTGAEKNPDMTPHALSKLANKNARADKDVDASEQAYYEAVLKIRGMQESFATLVADGCDAYEQIEIERINEMFQKLTQFHDILSDMADPLYQSADALKESIDAIDANVDIQEFCDLKHLGKLRPTPLHYEEIVQKRSTGIKKMPKRSNPSFFGQASDEESAAVNVPANKNFDAMTPEEKLQYVIQQIKKERKSRDGLEMMVSLYADDPERRAPVESQLKECKARINELKEQKKKLQTDLGLNAGADDDAPIVVDTPAVLFQAQVLYNYDPQTDEEIALREGSVVDVTYAEGEDWWQGTLDGYTGLFPATYVQRI